MFIKRIPQEIRFLIFSIATIAFVIGASGVIRGMADMITYAPAVFCCGGSVNLPTVTPGYPPVIDPYAPPPTQTPVPSPTPPISPINLPVIINPNPYSSIINQTIRFKSAFADIPFEGFVTDVTKATVLNPDYGDPVYPQGIFLVVFMDVTNNGLESDDVGMYSSFRVVDSANRKFDMASLEVQWAAEDQFHRSGVYTTIQPGFRVPLVFVFDILPASDGLHLESLSPW